MNAISDQGQRRRKLNLDTAGGETLHEWGATGEIHGSLEHWVDSGSPAMELIDTMKCRYVSHGKGRVEDVN